MYTIIDASRNPPMYRMYISRLPWDEEGSWKCLGSQFCSRIVDFNPWKTFPFFALIFTAEQFSSLDDIWQLMGSVNRVKGANIHSLLLHEFVPEHRSEIEILLGLDTVIVCSRGSSDWLEFAIMDSSAQHSRFIR